MRVFSYIVARDFGFAPNPFHGWCTLATCKPSIRRTAQVGDWILGTGSKKHDRVGQAIYAMQVEEALSFDQYWADERFRGKRPVLEASRKLAFGDNIYYRSGPERPWLQLDSHHSFHDGSPNPENVEADTAVDRVLLSRRFVYWGDSGPEVPAHLRAFPGGEDLCITTQGHKCRFSEELVAEAITWIESFGMPGCVGRPGQWPSGIRDIG